MIPSTAQRLQNLKKTNKKCPFSTTSKKIKEEDNERSLHFALMFGSAILCFLGQSISPVFKRIHLLKEDLWTEEK